MVRILAAALDARDKYTLGHSARVAWLSLLIGRKLGLDEEELKELEMACFLHDIGKIRVPDLILTKEEELDDEEHRLIMQHPVHGAEILGLSHSLHKYIPVVLHHHEWYNGQGYPHGLRGEEIHLYAQIVTIADSYDAMTSSRPYRLGRSKSAATREIKKFRGTQFSPRLVDIFVESLGDVEEVEEISLTG
jgi:HD-GYP domain-containing protein (c-di-GMP phosphodiesterase class II)